VLRFGVEVEVARVDINIAENLVREHNLSRRYEQGWRTSLDCSINPYGSEFISPIFTWDTRNDIFTVIDAIKKTGGFCNQSCGFHVHLSGDFPESWNEMKEHIWKWYLSILPGFKPAKRRRDGYCKEELGTNKHQIVHPVCEHLWQRESPHLELRLFNAHLCKRWMYRCIKVSRELGIILESLVPAVGQPALIGV